MSLPTNRTTRVPTVRTTRSRQTKEKPESARSAALTPDQRKLNLDSFEIVWQTIRDKHWDPKLGGLDWQAVHDELRPKVEAATTMEQARAA